MPDTPVTDLRDWARGVLPIEAATELLIRGGFAQTWRPWVHAQQGIAQGWWIDFAMVPIQAGGMSGGERRFLRIAASLGSDEAPQVVLGDVLPGLDRAKVDLVLAAMAHAAGTHQGSEIVYEDGKPVGFKHHTESLHPWPDA